MLVQSHKKNPLQGIAISMTSKVATLTDEPVKEHTAITTLTGDTIVTVKDIDGNENSVTLPIFMTLVISDEIVTMTTNVDVFID